ncbi:MAG: protein phosphatase 2C domain-containing protein [Spirochaetales bacterium]|nr:protein phosphatase 2C domain-containing protein [Spirochaetales bacterium]
MEWNVNSAVIIGNEHERMKRNRQDFCGYFLPGEPGQKRYGGVICDGCSAGIYSEVGAALIGNLILNLMKTVDIAKPDVFSSSFEDHIIHFIRQLILCLKISSGPDKIGFIHHFLLTTFIFAVIEEDRIIIGRSGDGVIVINDQVKIIDQQGKPHYIAYREIPQEYFKEPRGIVNDFSVNMYSASSINRFVIASDGLFPAIKAQKLPELFGTEKRQLQRKFNVWQQKEKFFYDDVSCIVFNKVEPSQYSARHDSNL